METQIKRPTADDVMRMLKEGNERFRFCTLKHPNLCEESRLGLVNSQEPLATILCCADSRVPPVTIFDLGLGDLFVVRVAGNIINDQILGSIEYAASHLHTPLIMVLGHSNCGAISAVAKGVQLDGHMSTLIAPIQAALKKVDENDENYIDNAARELARLMADRIATSEPIIADLVAEGKVRVVPAFYDLDTGEAEFLEINN